MTRHVCRTLREGLYGWEVTDCVVTMDACDYFASDGARVQDNTPRSTAADFRKLTPMVLMLALERAATVVCEPMVRVRIETPSESVGAVLASVGRLGRLDAPPSTRGDLSTITTTMPAARVPALQRQIPGLTGGEGVVEADWAGYEPVTGRPPVRRRTTPNPLVREEYLRAGRPRM
jgi:ribosomal protection tetracycline resistance protein